ncbi:MAG: hypothetical protein IRZ32_14640 [Solirubrobacteraceae bacterium]|nr:hypothetical protein [Solirubrobacteraceae bacterium]
MEHVPEPERTDFPRLGARARQWQRFERALHEWLQTPEGRFVTWCAQREIDDVAVAGSSRA